MRLLGLYFAVGLIFLMSDVSRAVTRYVAAGSQSPDPAGKYLDWESAADNIADAVAVAAAGDLILVSNGVYVLAPQTSGTDRGVVLQKAITVRSWNNGEMDRDGTIIDGDYPNREGRCVYMNHANAIFEGFTLTNGYATDSGGGGGARISAGTLRNCRITNCQFIPGYDGGGGVRINSQDSLIADCEISYCSTTSRGGGVHINGGAKMRNCLIFGNWLINTANVYGGGIFAGDEGTEIENCQIYGNEMPAVNSASGGGLYMGAVLVRNCLFYDNMGFVGGAIRTSGAATLENCTVVYNRGGFQRGIYVGSSASTLINVLAVGNGASPYLSDVFDHNYRNQPAVYTNCAFGAMQYPDAGGRTQTIAQPWPGENTLAVTTDVMVGDGNYRLAPGSPCINAGYNLPWMAGAVDLDDRRRVDRVTGKVDIGCYEYQYFGTVLILK